MQEVAGEKPMKRCKTVASLQDGDDATSASGSKHHHTAAPLPRRPFPQQQQLIPDDDEDVLLVTYAETTKMVDRLPMGVDAFVLRVKSAFSMENKLTRLHISRVWQGELIDVMDNDSFAKLKKGTKLMANCVRSASTDSSICSTASREHEKAMLAIQNGAGEQQHESQPTTPRRKRAAKKLATRPAVKTEITEADPNAGMLTTASVTKIAAALAPVAKNKVASACSSISTRKIAVPPAVVNTSMVADAIAGLGGKVKVEPPKEGSTVADDAVGGEVEDADDDDGEGEEEEDEEGNGDIGNATF